MAIKVLHIGKYYDPYHGGIETVVKNICQGLVKDQEIELEILCSNDSIFSKKEIIDGIKMTRMSRIANIKSQAINPFAFFTILNMAKQFDLIHIHSPNPIIELISLFLPKDKKIIITYHSDVVRQKFLLKFYRPILKAFLKRVDIISIPTENHIKYSSFLPEFKSKCIIIPFSINESLGVSCSELEKKKRELQKEYGKFILYVGRLVEYKGIEYLIDALKDAPELKVVVLGSGPHSKKLRTKAIFLNIEKQISFLGRIEDGIHFKAFYHACDFVVLPSISVNENFGMIQLEAMLCKKAVVTTNLKSGVPVVGEKGKTCLLSEPKNSIQLQKNLQLLYNNPELSIKMGNAGHKRYLEKYTSSIVTNLHLEIYAKLLSPDIKFSIPSRDHKKAANE